MSHQHKFFKILKKMFYIPKSISRPVLSLICRNLPFAFSRKSPKIEMKIIPAPPIVPKTYINKNEQLKRVLSPHLSIYKAQITSMMSITLRMTGFTLGIMAWTVGLIFLITDLTVDEFIDELKKVELNDCWWTAARTILVYPFAFHFVAGVRHLLFDTSRLMEKPQFRATGYAAIIMAFIVAIGLGMIEDLQQKWQEIKQDEEK